MMNLGQMKTYFKGNLNRTDITDDQAVFYIKSSLARLERTVRLPFMERYRTLTAGADGTVIVPTDFIEMIDISVADGPSYDPTGIVNFKKSRYSATRVYTRIQNYFHFKPALSPGDQIDIFYYGSFLEVNNDIDTNPIIGMAPDIVMLGACADACIYFVDKRGGTFEQLFQDRMAELNDEAADAGLRGGVIVEQLDEY